MALWSRLWGVLGQAERQEVIDAQLGVETFVNLCVAFSITSIAVGVSAIATSIRSSADWWGLVCSAVFAGFAVGSYDAAVFAFSGVSDSIIRCIDLYRVRVLLTFGLAAPKTFREEREMFEDLNALFAHATATAALDGRTLREVKIK